MKTYFKYVMLLFVAALTMGFTSCSDDDDDNNSENVKKALIGTWQSDDSNLFQYYRMTFKEGGIFTDELWYKDLGKKVSTCHWQMIDDDYLEFTKSTIHLDKRIKFVIKGNKLIFNPGTKDENVYTKLTHH